MKKIKTRLGFIIKFKEIYQYLQANKKLSILDGLLPRQHKNRTNDNILSNAKKYNNIKEWRSGDESGYAIAHKRNIFKQCTNHMVIFRFYELPNKLIIEEAKKYNHKTDWKDEGKYFTYAYNRGSVFFKQCTSHMKRKNTGRAKSVINLDTNECFRGVFSVPGIPGKGLYKLLKYRRGIGFYKGYRWAYCDEKGKVIK